MSGINEPVAFERTRSGKIGKFNFYKVPLIWVEGDDDLVFFGKVLREKCRLEAANGRTECEFLAEELVRNNWPYAVIMDGDYSILGEARVGHDRILVLERYAIENYLFDKSVIQAVCQDYAATQDDLKEFDQRFERLESLLEDTLKRLVYLDAVNQKLATGAKCFPTSAEELFSKGLKVDPVRLEVYTTRAEVALAGKATSMYEHPYLEVIARYGFVSLLRGHFAFAIIRLFIGSTLRREDIGCSVDNRGLLILLSTALWASPPTDAHRSLRERALELAKRTKDALDAFAPPVQLVFQPDPGALN